MMWKLSKCTHMGCGGIGHAAVREGVGCEQVTEFIIPARRGNSEDGNQGDAKCNHQQPDHNDGQNLAPRQPSKAVFHIFKAGEASLAAARIA